MKKINKITASWEPMGEIPKVYKNETYEMNEMQKGAYEALKYKSKIILNAPTASGKTLATCWINAKKLTDDRRLKAIITVPQTIIADGFYGPFNLPLEDGNIIHWCPINLLFNNDNSQTNTKLIKQFLNREGQINNINDRILVCSHASFVNAFNKHSKLFKNLVIVIDEAHHINYSEAEGVKNGNGIGITSALFCNQMGSIVSNILKNKSKNISLIFSTATFFRGDRLPIIPKRYINNFETFYYPMDEYLKNCHWLSSFSYDFVPYKSNYTKKMIELFNEKIGKTIVYIPNVNSKQYVSGSKLKDVNNVYKAIAGNSNFEIKELNDGRTLIKKKNKWIKVVNLVDDNNIELRNKRKKLIIESHKNDKNLIDVVITLNMFREGANWKWADREIIIGIKNSLTDMYQITGRLFRDAENKKHIQVIQLLPFRFDQINKEAFRDNLNECIRIIFATMLLEDVIIPLDPAVPTHITNNKQYKRPINHLRMAVKDENQIHSIQQEILIKAITAQHNGEVNFECNNKKSKDKFKTIVRDVLISHGIKKNHDKISQQIYKYWLRESIKTTKGIDLSHVDFNTIQINPLSFIFKYTSGM